MLMNVDSYSCPLTRQITGVLAEANNMSIVYILSYTPFGSYLTHISYTAHGL